ncbi:MAG TPA: hypothetical protein VN461_09880 [Vicinamibacteria bacterium]|nr:hypothetical protein [Vicinamibacteria bacterium]
MTFSGSLLIVGAVGVASFVSGRLLTGSLGFDLLRPLTPAGAAASAVLGTALLTLGFGWLSLLGLPAPVIALVLAALHLVLLEVCAYRRALLEVFRPRGPASAWAGLLGVTLASALVSLLPVLRTGGFSIGNDTYTYCAFSEWLQTHGFGSPCLWDPASPVTAIPFLWQQEGYPLGIAHFLALVQAGSGAPLSLLVYPAVSAWGMVLQTAALFVVARWVFLWGHAWAGGASLAFAVMAHPGYWGHHNGFLQQTCALPALLLALAVLARGIHERRWRLNTAILVALLAAFLLNVYLPLVPALGAAGIAYAAACSMRARRHGPPRRTLAHLGIIVLLVLILGFPDLRGAVGRLFRFAGSDAGGHVSLSVLQFLEFAMGVRVLGLHATSVRVPFLSAALAALAPLGLGLTVAGLFHAWRQPRARVLAAATLAFAGALAYYALWVHDPWTGLIGHTWNVFKLMQWAFPFVLLFQVAALRQLLRSRGPRLAPALFLAVPLSSLWVHGAWSESLGLSMREIIRAERPLAEAGVVQRRIRELPPGTLLVVGRPVSAHRWLAPYTALLAYPRPIVGDWTESPSIGLHPKGGAALYRELLGRIGEAGVVPLLCGFIPFQTGGFESLGGGFARLLPSERPLLIHVVNPGGPVEERVPGPPRFTIQGGRTKLILYSPIETGVELSLKLRPYPPAPGGQALTVFLTPDDFDHRTVRSAVEAGPQLVLPLDGRTELKVETSLPPGLATVVLSPPPALALGVDEIQIRRLANP